MRLHLTELLTRSETSNRQTVRTRKAQTTGARLAAGISAIVSIGRTALLILVLIGAGLIATISTALLWLFEVTLLGTANCTKKLSTNRQPKKSLPSCTISAVKTMRDGRVGQAPSTGGKLNDICNSPVLFDWYTVEDIEQFDDEWKVLAKNNMEFSEMASRFDKEFGN